MDQQASTVTPIERRQTAIGRVLNEAPYLSRCSDNKTAAIVRPRKYAVRYPYMQVNRPDVVSWLVFDVDADIHTNAWIWHDEDLPAPNLIVRNRKSGSFHLYYAIQPVLTGADARSKPIAYMKAVYEAMRVKLQADAAYSGPVAKTPGHPWWSTTELHGHQYTLGELSDYVDLTIKPLWSTGPNLEAAAHSRHCTLFEDLRFYAYSIVVDERAHRAYSHFYRLLEAFAHNRNTFQGRGFAAALTVAQVKATVKSVARWTWDRYTGRAECHRGVMALDRSLPIQERQRLAAKRTHRCRRSMTEGRVRAACREVQKAGKRLSQTAVAAVANLSRQTVSRYGHVFNEVIDRSATVVALRKGTAIEPVTVKYGVYQISARSWLRPVCLRAVEFLVLTRFSVTFLRARSPPGT